MPHAGRRKRVHALGCCFAVGQVPEQMVQSLIVIQTGHEALALSYCDIEFQLMEAASGGIGARLDFRAALGLDLLCAGHAIEEMGEIRERENL